MSSSPKLKEHKFHDKLLLNQWLLSLFGICPFTTHKLANQEVRPFRLLADLLHDQKLEGLDHDNLHYFYRELVSSNLFASIGCQFNKSQMLCYEENIGCHTRQINQKRSQPVTWKYYQWLTLMFAEIYLDRYFEDKESLLNQLNGFVELFNSHWKDFHPVPPYNGEDLNKLCLQNATGSGKTLIMHVNLLQFRHYAVKHRKDKELSRVVLLTPNERLSAQHASELEASGINSDIYAPSRGSLFDAASGLNHVDILEITKLADQEGPTQVATRSLGEQNLLLLDEGHRGMSGKDEGVWFTRRSELCAKGFTFEYSATFEQAVQASKRLDIQDSYAKSILFDYSYRWFYEDGFGKDYRILNLPRSFEEFQSLYLTACLLKFYQQLRIYESNTVEFLPFNIEKPLWVFVGSTVSAVKSKQTGKIDETASDVAKAIVFVAEFLYNSTKAKRRIEEILNRTGQETGLLSKGGNDIFAGAFNELSKTLNNGATINSIYEDILATLFHTSSSGLLSLERTRGESGEVVLHAGTSEIPFGLINVGNPKNLCEHVVEVAQNQNVQITTRDSEFTESMFASMNESSSSINLLIGSKKFIEGWDCWRVSTMGLMHVGKSEGAQIIQLFGRGVRLKGYNWSLKRSGHVNGLKAHPNNIEELETLNVFGIQADFMEKFRAFLEDEGLPGNESHKTFQVPLNVTYDFGKKLKILRPKRKQTDGSEYEFKKDGPAPTLGAIPKYFNVNSVVCDWYPRIQEIRDGDAVNTGNRQSTPKNSMPLGEKELALLDYDSLYFELESYKLERGWYNLNITKSGISELLKDSSWYKLYLPANRRSPENYAGVLLFQQVALALLKKYCERYYKYREREFLEPRLELRELSPDDDNIPQEDFHRLIVDSNAQDVILQIKRMLKEIEQNKDDLLSIGQLNVCKFGSHLFEPLIHIQRGGKITNQPVALNESEYKFIKHLKNWHGNHKSDLENAGVELFLLRNMSRGKGVGFFEAGNFHPDFILWTLVGKKQHITFIEPHGLIHEGPDSEKIRFHKQIKEIEDRINDPNVVLNCFILSWTGYSDLKWDKSRDELENMHIFFMQEDRDKYIDKMFSNLEIQF